VQAAIAEATHIMTVKWDFAANSCLRIEQRQGM
jgi:hypothetical protein